MKQLLFSVTKDDFDWQFFRGSGAGGQKRNKTSSACRCIHRESGAKGTSQDERQQSQNRKLAFTRCISTKEFQHWIKLKTAATAQGFDNIDKLVDEMMQPENIRIEYF
jgi:protein subunit release factor B